MGSSRKNLLVLGQHVVHTSVIILQTACCLYVRSPVLSLPVLRLRHAHLVTVQNNCQGCWL